MRTHHDQSGSALTELAIVTPLFIMLVFWAQFFTDLGILKLKTQEVSRFGLWEMTAQRPIADVQKDLTTKFADLSSPDARTGQKPLGTRSFPQNVTITASNFSTTLNAPFEGTVPSGGSQGNGGGIADVLTKVNEFLGKTVTVLIGLFGFEMTGAAQLDVTLETKVAIFPKMKILNIDLNGGVTSVKTTAKSPKLLVNTWKAWPGTFNSKYGFGGVNESPYNTYGAPSTPERIVSKRIAAVANYGDLIAKVMDVINNVMQFIGLPGLMLTGTWKEQRGGPIAMFPGARYTNTNSPGYGKAVQRLGDMTYGDESLHLFDGSPSFNYTDRARFTTPGMAVQTDYWTGQLRGGIKEYGGSVRTANADKNMNPYKKSYQCRDAFYLGTQKGENTRYGSSLTQWAQSGYGAQCR